MAKYSVLKNAPITEALIDIHVKLPDDYNIEQLKSLYSADKYPDIKERRKWEGKIEFKKGSPPQTNGYPGITDGFLYTSGDKKQVVNVRIDGFTFSRLYPYEHWEAFRNEAYRLWQRYRERTNPEMITRVALRFINKIKLPHQQINFNDYFTAAPTVPKGLPQGVRSFLSRIVIIEPSIEGAAIVTQAFEPMISPDYYPVIILDIDVFKETPEGINEEDLWNLIGTMRDLKNDIFFESITPKTEELFV